MKVKFECYICELIFNLILILEEIKKQIHKQNMIKFLLKQRKKSLIALGFFLTLWNTNSINAFSGGTYTIDPSQAASASNYQSFRAFANDLRNITRGDGGPNQYAVGGSGVQGNVVVNAAPGTYTGQVQLTSIVGVSSTRTVTINGNGAIIEFLPTSTANHGVIELNGTDFFTFNNLEVRMLGTNYGSCFRIYGIADNNVIKNCKLRCDNMNNSSSTPLTYSAYIWFNNGTTSVTAGNAGNNNLFDSLDMRSGNGTSHGPYYGICAYGSTTPSQTNAICNNVVSNNYLRDFYLYGIYFYYCYGNTFRNNTITNQGRTGAFTTKYGIYQYYGTGIVDNNRVFCLNGNTPQASVIYPIYFYNGSSTITWTYANKITNNFFFDFNTTSMYCYAYWYIYTYNANQSLDIEHNTVIFDHPSNPANTGTNYTFYSNYARSFKNNIVYNNLGGTGTKYLLYNGGSTLYPAYNWTAFQNNDFRFGPNASGTLYHAYGPQNGSSTSFGNISTFSDWLNTSFPTSNLNVDPFIKSNNPASFDLTPTSLEMCNKGQYIAALPKDNSGATRSTTKPDIGALEYYADVKLTRFDFTFPSPTCSGFTSTISGNVKNTSLNPVKNPVINYTVNGGAPFSLSLNTTILPGDSLNFSFPNAHKFSNSGNTTVILHNLAKDDNITNDSITVNGIVTPAPGGSVMSHNTSASSTFAIYNIDGKPDVTFPSEAIAYDFTEPSRLGYLNSDYGTKWNASITAKSINGTNANALVSTNGSAPLVATFLPTTAWEDSTIEIAVKFISLVNGCDTTFFRKILVAPKARPDFILPNPICEKSDIFFDNTTTVSSGAVEYEWDFGDGSAISTETSPVHTYAAYGQYNLIMRAKTNPYNFVTTKTLQVNVTEIPQAKIININKCQGENVVLGNGTIYGGNGSTSYTWSFSDNSADVTTTNTSTITKGFATPGGYTVTLKATADGCSDVVTKTVYQFAKPDADFSILSGRCLNETFQFENNSEIFMGTFGNHWDMDDASNIASDMDPSYKFQTAGNKDIKLIVTSEFGCKDSLTKSITVEQIPTTDFSFPFACDRTATPFTNLTNLNGELLNTYEWDFAQGSIVTLANPTVNWSNLGPRTIKLTTKLVNGCKSEMSKNINVGVQPTADFEFETKCAGSAVPFTNLTTFPKGEISYDWNFGDQLGSTEAAPVHTYSTLSGQTFFVKLKASIKDGCADSIVKSITISPLPTTCDFDITRNFTVNPRNYVFTPTGGAMNGITYTWVTGDGNKVNSNGAAANYTFNGDLQYCITMIAKTSDGCECSRTKCVEVSTGTNSISNNNFVIYPNPSAGIFSIESSSLSSNSTINIYNVIGELVYTSNEINKQIDLSHLNSGMYVVKITDGNNTTSQKINIIK